MDSFTQKTNSEIICWKTFLISAIEGKATSSEIERAKDLCVDWRTDVIGAQCYSIDRAFNGRPKDAYLASLGERFTTDVLFLKWDHALSILGQVEKQAAKIVLYEKR